MHDRREFVHRFSFSFFFFFFDRRITRKDSLPKINLMSFLRRVPEEWRRGTSRWEMAEIPREIEGENPLVGTGSTCACRFYDIPF